MAITQNLPTEYMACIAGLKKSSYSMTQSQKTAEYCLEAARTLPAKLPDWLVSTAARRYDDVEEMIFALPQVMQEWYNKNDIPMHIFAPDAALARSCMQSLEKWHPPKIDGFELVHIKADGEIQQEKGFHFIILLCPGRYQSLQLAGVTKKLSANSRVLLLDPDGTDTLEAAIHKNDIKRLEFLFARFEIERQADLKRQRLHELLAQFEAMMGGTGHGQ